MCIKICTLLYYGCHFKGFLTNNFVLITRILLLQNNSYRVQMAQCLVKISHRWERGHICFSKSLIKKTTPLRKKKNDKARYTHANQMRVRVHRTANMHCAICKWFAYRSPRTKICRDFAQTQRELGEPGVLCLP